MGVWVLVKLCKALGALGSCGVDSWLQFLCVRSFLPSNPVRIIQQICAEEPTEEQSR